MRKLLLLKLVSWLVFSPTLMAQGLGQTFGGNRVVSVVPAVPNFVHVTKISKTGPQQDALFEALDFIIKNADEQCQAAFPGLVNMALGLEGDRTTPETILLAHGIYAPYSLAA